MGREAEGSVWTPVAGCFLEDDVLGDGLEIWSRNTFTQPFTLHLKVSDLIFNFKKRDN